CRIVGWANCHGALRAGAIQIEAAQRAAAAGEKAFADGNMRAAKCRLQPNTQAIGPDQRRVTGKRAIVSSLPQEAGEIGAGTQKIRTKPHLKALIDTMMGVERV